MGPVRQPDRERDEARLRDSAAAARPTRWGGPREEGEWYWAKLDWAFWERKAKRKEELGPWERRRPRPCWAAGLSEGAGPSGQKGTEEGFVLFIFFPFISKHFSKNI